MRPIPSPISREVFDLMNKAQSMVERIDVLSKAKKCKDCGDGKCDCKDCPECGGKMNKMGCKMGCGGKMAKGDGGTFTIGDAQRRNAGMETDEPRDEPDYSGETGNAYPSMLAINAKPTDAPDMKLDEGPPREQKRQGMRGSDRMQRGVKVKKPGFRSNEQMPLSDDSPRVKESQMAKSESGAQPGFNTSFDTKPQDIAFVSESGGQTRNAYYTTNQHLLDSDDVANKGATSVSVSLEKLASMLNPHEGGGASRLDDGGVLKNNPN